MDLKTFTNPSLLGVRFFNVLYFVPIVLLIITVIFLRHLCVRRGKGFTHKLILALLWLNFSFHFLKQLNPFYLADVPFSLTKSSPENLCAILVMASPFIYIWGNVYLKDYMYYVGIVSAVVVFLYPTTALKLDLGSVENVLEVARFYSCHTPLFICGFLMVNRGLHTLNYHRLWALPITFCLFEAVIFLNALALKGIGVWKFESWEAFFARDNNPLANQSATMGPPSSVDPFLGWLYYLLIPGLMTYWVNGQIHFVPVVYLLFPMYLATAILGPLLSLPYEKRHMQMDLTALKQKIAMRRNARA